MNDVDCQPELSIVATVYNSAPIVPELVRQVSEIVKDLGISYEIILVDDGSKDNSTFAIEKEASEQKAVKAVILSRNFGQQIAMSAGLHHASGKYVLIMDGDLQNPIEEIANLYRKVQEGFDIVFTKSLKKNNAVDSLTSWLFWRFLKVVMKVNITENQLMMRIMTKAVATYFRTYPEKNRTVAAITHDIGMKTTEINVINKKREAGKSNYNTKKRFNLALDVVLDFSNRPLSFIFNIGVLIFFATSIASIYYLYAYFVYSTLPGFTSLILLIMFFGSVNLMCIGILARYMANIYTEVKGRPLFLVRKTLNFDPPKIVDR
jgi:glycosyltransferase involved in cell wall biosynthesis